MNLSPEIWPWYQVDSIQSLRWSRVRQGHEVAATAVNVSIAGRNFIVEGKESHLDLNTKNQMEDVVSISPSLQNAKLTKCLATPPYL